MHHEILTSPNGEFKLCRPGSEETPSLRAWDAADEYLLNIINQHYPNESLSIFNDQFGALACGLNHMAFQWISDSYCAHQACKTNLVLNQLNNHFNMPSILEPWSNDFKLGVVKLPRNLSFLDYILERSSEHQIKTLLIAGMMKHLPKTILSHLQKYGEVERLPFVKKATIFKLTLTNHIKSNYPKKQLISGLKLETHANVFGRDKLDPGAAFFLEHMDKLPIAASVADLCSGSGILGLKYKQIHPSSHISFFDESHMAISSSLSSWQLNNLQGSHHGKWDDGLKQSNPASFDLILCNPPFHEQNTVGDHIAKRLFDDSKRCLKKSGKIIVVGNRHLGYHVTLKKYFKTVKQIASNSKFVLLEAYD